MSLFQGKQKRIFVIRRRVLVLPAAIVSICLLCWLTTLPAYISTAATERQLPIYSVEREEKVCALSFDAAWGSEDTQTLIDILGEANVRTTFFVVGEWVEKYPEAVRALSEAGHEVMCHSDTHAHFNTLTAEAITQDIRTCCDKIEQATGTRPTLFRPPYGEYDDHVVSTVRGMGLDVIQWDVDSLDWKEIPAAEITQRVTSKVQPGSIVLFHNAAKHTPEALPGILAQLQADGYRIVPVSELVLPEPYTIDHTGKQHPSAPS